MDDLPATEGAPTPARPFDRARDLPRLEQVSRDLGAVEAALARLEDGTYGQCRVCGEPIDDDYLAVAPATDACEAHAVDGSA